MTDIKPDRQGLAGKIFSSWFSYSHDWPDCACQHPAYDHMYAHDNCLCRGCDCQAYIAPVVSASVEG